MSQRYSVTPTAPAPLDDVAEMTAQPAVYKEIFNQDYSVNNEVYTFYSRKEEGWVRRITSTITGTRSLRENLTIFKRHQHKTV